MKCEKLHGRHRARIKYPPNVPAISGNYITLWSVGSMPKISYTVERSATGWNYVCGRLPWQWKTMGSLEEKKKDSGAYIINKVSAKTWGCSMRKKRTKETDGDEGKKSMSRIRDRKCGKRMDTNIGSSWHGKQKKKKKNRANKRWIFNS